MFNKFIIGMVSFIYYLLDSILYLPIDTIDMTSICLDYDKLPWELTEEELEEGLERLYEDM